jgi:phosphoribosylformylglycinamidine synthase
MTPYEIMLSESQERMLIVCRPEDEAALQATFEKWDLNAAHIGEVTEGERVKVYWHDELVADVPAEHLCLGGGAPVYDRETKRPAYLDATQAFTPTDVPDITPTSAGATLLQLLAAPNIASKAWVFEQYDTMVRTNTLVGPGPSDAAVVRVKNTNKGLAVKTDCNPRYVYLNPRRGAQIAVAESARNVVCAGGQPLAITNCLNFGNPYKPEMYWTFVEAIGGISEACRVLNTPVTGGNVSFYNENPEGAVFPTPTIGMLGLVENAEAHATLAKLPPAGDIVALVSPETWQHRNDIGGSEYLATIHEQATGDAPHLDLAEEHAVQQAVLHLIRSGLATSAHDVSDGGLAVCLAEQVIFSEGQGLDLAIDADADLRLDALLFGEAQSRIVCTLPANEVEAARAQLANRSVQFTALGTVTDTGRLKVKVNDATVLNLSRGTMRLPYTRTLPQAMDAPKT